jgi:malonyl-CoA/methylmalonyl-CoA synthetase
MLAETHIQWQKVTGTAILERYGMTETNMNSSNPYDGDRRAGTVGFSLPGVEIRITDPETGRELSQGNVGSIEIRGQNVFSGYWQMPEKTKEEIRDDGFFISGDIGVFDDQGYLSIVGRSKDLIISGGYNVYPKEIEILIDKIEGVSESAVIGVPHPDFGEGVVAIVVKEFSASIDEAGINAVIGGTIAKYKQPKIIDFVEELPRNTMGKVLKNQLRDERQNYFISS